MFITQFPPTSRLPIPGNRELETEEYRDDQEIGFDMRTWENGIT